MRRVAIDYREKTAYPGRVGVDYVTKPSRINNEKSIQAIKTTTF